MKKKLIITESQYNRLINEQEDYTEQLLLLINSNDETNLEMVKEIAPGQGIDLVQFLSDNIEQIEKPYFYKFNLLGLNKNKQKEIFKNVSLTLQDNHDRNDLSGSLSDTNGNLIYIEYTNGYWSKSEYDSNGNEIYYVNSKGYWRKWEYDENGREIYYERSDGYWSKREYNENGEIVYWENSSGEIIDNRED
jgi:hypothetical protein